ncbi:EH signature domain-containing protein [Desulforegula conservatrix]|uniref:EH signature domain-containing protein n=1 Tax=Desulforegula conservatrix TaxID=153026 RepID=UPI000406ABED|nr:EH signature domain-containing protein [Desulforegula conservatrix]
MNPLNTLISDLNAINIKVAGEMRFGDDSIKKIQTEAKKIHSWLSHVSNTKPPDKMIRDAVLSFRSSFRLKGSRETRFVCWGAATRLEDGKYLLIEDDRLFQRLMTSVDGYLLEPKEFRRCFRGLLAAYFGYDPDDKASTETGKKNWEFLRFYLEKKISQLSISGLSMHDWMNAILEHRNLLSNNPCERYGKGFLTGEQAELDISASTWVSRAIFKARFSAAIECGDDEFISYLPKLMKMLEDRRYARFLDKGLSMILDRYSSFGIEHINPELMYFSVRHWKNPWIFSEISKWKMVSSEARNMVARWIRVDLLKRFFEFFSGDGFNSSRRSDFWIRHIARISEMYFALGRDAMTDRRPEFMDQKRKMEGRLIAIDDGLSILHNNALIMKVGDHWFVEFGGVGGAVYVYSQLPFSPDETVNVNVSMLKDRNLAKDRLHHKDNYHGFSRWEEQFEFHLENFFWISR